MVGTSNQSVPEMAIDSHQSLWISPMWQIPRFILEKRFDDFNQLHADLKEIEPSMCAVGL